MKWSDILARFAGHGDADVSRVVAEAQKIDRGFSRRAFLRGALALTSVAATVDLDALLWTPSTSIIVPELAPAAFGGGNTLVTPDWVTAEVVKMFQNNLKVAHLFTSPYDAPFEQKFRVRP